ncbi:uncharacterized protein E0L32_000532 [Thyridium curvatum]|uniref:PQ loop repeat protein n=1 Tax=Thyridium curvatum TaxID=1093900 RepID=A0A507BBC6_9PEZI|nr:uncharacterized protein E0L32_000532 [Thyridium curvatum]TPX14138.1 hypothetical protein E0L32_000532 [Thyridium curvatum]
MDFVFDDRTRCDELREPGVVSIILSLIILIGLLISYLPQHYRIISRGTSEGISPYFVLLGVTSATSGFANILTLPQSRQDVGCCKELDTFHCMAGLLGIAQLGVQWICFSFILILFLVFFRHDDTAVPEVELQDDQPQWQTALTVGSLCIVHGLVVIIISAIFATIFPQHLSIWANALGLMAAILAAIQYLPQIYTTYHLKHVGSLSIPMMCIQTPGGFLFAFSLWTRLGWSGWSSWGIFLLTALMQGILLSMAIWYELKRRAPEAPVPASPKPDSLPSRRRPIVLPSRLDDNTPSRYSAHPEHYGTTPDEISDIIERQDGDAATETQPLLRPGGIGDPRRNRKQRRG